ncbi:metal-dependent hydrolase [Lacunimicrobium album]
MAKSTITWLGHSCFLIETNGATILMDPFLADNPAATVKPEDLDPDVIILTHGHGDHVADAAPIAMRAGSLVVSTFEVCNWMEKQGVAQTHAMNHGGSHKFEFGVVKFTQAVHSSSMPDGSYGGQPAGVLLKLIDGTIYHAGDTALFSDMKLIGEEGIDIAILPIGDNYTMGPTDAVRAAEFLQAKRVIPCHYNTWEVIAQDGKAFASKLREVTGFEGVILKVGESVEI